MKKILKNILHRFNLEIHYGWTIPMNSRRMEELLRLFKLFEKIEDLEGDIVECGVGKGRTFLFFAFLAWREKKNRILWGFDSFEGFPTPTAEDISKRNPQKGEWADASLEMIQNIFAYSGLPKTFVEKNTKLIKGFFEETLERYEGKIAFLHIDADLYDSYKVALKTLFPKVVGGGLSSLMNTMRKIGRAPRMPLTNFLLNQGKIFSKMISRANIISLRLNDL